MKLGKLICLCIVSFFMTTFIFSNISFATVIDKHGQEGVDSGANKAVVEKEMGKKPTDEGEGGGEFSPDPMLDEVAQRLVALQLAIKAIMSESVDITPIIDAFRDYEERGTLKDVEKNFRGQNLGEAVDFVKKQMAGQLGAVIAEKRGAGLTEMDIISLPASKVIEMKQAQRAELVQILKGEKGNKAVLIVASNQGEIDTINQNFTAGQALVSFEGKTLFFGITDDAVLISQLVGIFDKQRGMILNCTLQNTSAETKQRLSRV